MCLGFVRSFASFFAVRAILGLTEGGLLPGIVLYLSGMYTRGEIALRIGVFYTAASLSGAFGGEFQRLFTARTQDSGGGTGAQKELGGFRGIGLILTFEPTRIAGKRIISHWTERGFGRMEVDLYYRGVDCKSTRWYDRTEGWEVADDDRPWSRV